MVFNQLIPQPGDELTVSQQDLLNNNISLNSVYATDHYAFNNATPSNGFHNKVTTPVIVGAAHPTTTTNPIFYAMSGTTALDAISTLQYSRGTSNQTPTPVTSIHSGPAPIVLNPAGTTNVFDFTGFTRVFATLYAADFETSLIRSEYFVCYVNNILLFSKVASSPSTTVTLTAQSNGNILQLLFTAPGGTLNQVYWTLHFHRAEI